MLNQVKPRIIEALSLVLFLYALSHGVRPIGYTPPLCRARGAPRRVQRALSHPRRCRPPRDAWRIEGSWLVVGEKRVPLIRGGSPGVVFMETPDATQAKEFWTSVTGTVTYDTTAARKKSGLASWRCGTAAGGGNNFLQKNSILVAANGRITAYFYIDDAPTGDQVLIQTLNASTAGFQVWLTSGRVLQLRSSTTFLASGSTLALDTLYRICLSYTVTSGSVNAAKVFLNGSQDISVTNRTVVTDATNLRVGQVNTPAGPGANVFFNFQHVYVDDSAALTDTGDMRVTSKLINAATHNNFDTTGGTGAVNERPISAVNYKQQAAAGQVHQDYDIQTAAGGDVDISSNTLVAFDFWVWAKAGTGAAGTPGIVHRDDTVQAVTLTTTAALYNFLENSAVYPSAGASVIGMRSSGAAADTFLYECGVLVAYLVVIPTATIASTLAMLTSALTAVMQPKATIASTIKMETAAFVAAQKYLATITSSLPMETSSLAAVQKYLATIAAILPMESAALTASQAGVITSTIASALVMETAALTAVMQPKGAIASALPMESSAFAALQKYLATLASALPMEQSSLVGVMQPKATISSTLAMQVAALIGAQKYLATIASSLVMGTASFVAAQKYLAAIATQLVMETSSLTAAQKYLATLASTLPMEVAALTGVMQPKGQIASTLKMEVAALVAVQIYKATMASQLPMLTDAFTAKAFMGVTISSTLAMLTAAFIAAFPFPSGSAQDVAPAIWLPPDAASWLASPSAADMAEVASWLPAPAPGVLGY